MINICPTELLKLLIFFLIPAMKTTQINKIQVVPRQLTERTIVQSQFFVQI